MDSPTPLNIDDDNNNQKDDVLKITENLSYDNQEYELKILKSYDNQNLIIKIESNDIENDEYYYQINYKLKDLYSLSYFFRQCYSIDEVFDIIENNKKLINEKTKFQAFNISFDDSKCILNIYLYLVTGEIQLITIELNKIKITDKEIINKLKEYIKYIKGIPGVIELIESYRNKEKEKEIFFPKSNIITNIEDFDFIYQELCKKLNKKELKLVQKYNALKDGDSAATFHEKCDNIGPNLTIIKTDENIILGGFTVNNWSPVIGNTKTDDLAFVFNFQKKKIYNIEKGENAIYCSKNTSIDFVNAKGERNSYSTIWVGDNCLDSQCLTCPQYSSYQGFSIDFELNNGIQFFYILEMEIYEIN